VSEGITVALAVDLDELRAAERAAMHDFQRIKNWAYAIADVIGQPRGDGPAKEEFETALIVQDFLHDLLGKAERIAAAQRQPGGF
jgi:hypothetical protein